MTRKEAKRRLKLVAEMWDPEVMRYNRPGCVVQIALGDDRWEATMVYAQEADISFMEYANIVNAWDNLDRDATIAAIKAL